MTRDIIREVSLLIVIKWFIKRFSLTSAAAIE